MTEEACYYLNKLLLRSSSLTTLNLTGCKIGIEGARRLVQGISNAIALRHLILRQCNLRNEGFHYIVKSLAANALLEHLDVSENFLDEGSAEDMDKLILECQSLKSVNFSWNNLYAKEMCEKLFKALISNGTITLVDLSWNSMRNESVSSLCNFIRKSEILSNLNLECTVI